MQPNIWAECGLKSEEEEEEEEEATAAGCRRMTEGEGRRARDDWRNSCDFALSPHLSRPQGDAHPQGDLAKVHSIPFDHYKGDQRCQGVPMEVLIMI